MELLTFVLKVLLGQFSWSEDFWIDETSTNSSYPTCDDPYGNYTTTPYPYLTNTTTNCPTGWVDSVEGCFLFHFTKNMSWREAQEECEALGGYLAEPMYEDQAALLTSLAFVEESIVGVHSWWIGLSDQGHDGRWIWQHSVQDVYYNNWAPGSPDYSNNKKDCAVMDGRNNFMWSDVNCADVRGSPVCQRSEQNTTSPDQYHVELHGGNSYSNGNVFAVNRDGCMGPVCDDHWTDTEAGVVCRQLGFSYGSARIGSYYGNVSYNFAMDQVYCDGNETYLQQCYYDTLDDCWYEEGAGVDCY